MDQFTPTTTTSFIFSVFSSTLFLLSFSPDFYSLCFWLPSLFTAGCWGSISDSYPFHHTLDWSPLWRFAEGTYLHSPSLNIRDNDLTTLIKKCIWSYDMKIIYIYFKTYFLGSLFNYNNSNKPTCLIVLGLKTGRLPINCIIFDFLCRQCWPPSSMSTSMAWWSNSWTSLHCGGATK